MRVRFRNNVRRVYHTLDIGCYEFWNNVYGTVAEQNYSYAARARSVQILRCNGVLITRNNNYNDDVDGTYRIAYLYRGSKWPDKNNILHINFYIMYAYFKKIFTFRFGKFSISSTDLYACTKCWFNNFTVSILLIAIALQLSLLGTQSYRLDC